MQAKKTILLLLIIVVCSLQPISSYGNSSYSNLRLGSRGNDVVRLQQTLQNRGYYQSSVDGIFGSITERAVINFQLDNKITVDGIAGTQTKSLLYSSQPNNNYSNLRFGSRGSKVTRLQQTLQNRGYYQSSIDGIFGKITERAVINFQSDNRLTVDGIAGTQTKSLLYSENSTEFSSQSYNSDDVYWLSRIINSEAQGEPYQGQVAVGNVVLNRVNSPRFPDTIYGVIFEYYKHIPQFSPVAEGTIYNMPSQSSVQAAKDSLNGARPVGNSMYFFNPDKSAGTWIVQNRQYLTRIGNHIFYL
ncbi:peptidoglycan-binding protein [Herbivorax sp. ANBcel31]|uniref:peptidoglycan-binding protein n=1 Tax=Herbivorax sp. ANBcel31 TaxID=3069754 RepID=UPI0027B6C147|nr:peptidoglycan-binding protein [Herbivorax sp. ANBcel31]MDQ2084854.1 peptidoglycan-binding protein [Herbivorax sp. ANBcel31]